MLKKLLGIFTLATLSAPALALTPIVDANGTLRGATGLDLYGQRYDVRFEDGTCNGLFGGCVDSAFSFVPAAGGGAAQQLLIQLFVDGPAGAFGSNPQKINGCTSTVSCRVMLPVAALPANPGLLVAYAQNGAAGQPDLFGFTALLKTDDTGNLADVTYAIFTPVPEPASWLLMISGFAALGQMMRRSRRIVQARPIQPRQVKAA